MNKVLTLSLLLCMLTGLSMASTGPQTETGKSPDLESLKNECELFENIINTSLRQAVAHPLYISEKARGTYLETYGLTFNLTVNLLRKSILFSAKPSRPEQQPPDDQLTISKIKSCMTNILVQYGDTLNHVPPDSRISIIVHILARTSVIDKENFDRIMVFTVTRQDIQQHLKNELNTPDFIRRIKYLEY
jgi:hypothetical protein